MTQKRQEILDIIINSNVPVNAKILKSKVNFNISTIYRTLEFLEKNKYIFSFELENEKYYFKDENVNFFVCDSCKYMEAIADFSEKEIKKEKNKFKKRGFSLFSYFSIFKGKCKECDK